MTTMQDDEEGWMNTKTLLIMKAGFILKVFLSALAGLLLLLGLAAMMSVPPRLAKFKKMEITGSEDSFVNLRFSAAVYNGNFFRIAANHTTLRIENLKNNIASISFNKTSIQRFDSADIEGEARVNLIRLLEVYKGLGAAPADLSFILHGDFLPLFFLHAFSIQKTFTREQCADLLARSFNGGKGIMIDSFRLKKTTLLNTEASFSLRITNPFGINIQLNDISAGLYSGTQNTEAGQAVLENKVLLHPGAAASVPVTLQVQNLLLLKTLITTRAGKQNSFTVKGTANVLINDIPVAFPFEVPAGNYQNN